MARSDRNGNGTVIEPTLLKSQLRAGFEGLRHRVTQARSRFQTLTPPTPPLLLSHTDQRDSETFVSGAYRRAGSYASFVAQYGGRSTDRAICEAGR